MDETPQKYHNFSIHKNDPHLTITTPIIILKNSLIQFPTIFVEKCLLRGYR